MKQFLYGSCLIAVLFSACSISKDISASAPALPTNFRNSALVPSADTGNIADLQWRQFFTEPNLQRLIDSAIVNNYDMQIALKNIESSRLLFKQVKWSYIPEAVLSILANSERPADNSFTALSLKEYGFQSKHIEDYSANLSLSWEADIWGKIRNQQKGALAAYLQTSEARKLIQTNIVAAVSQGYYNLLMLDEQLAIAKKNFKLNDSTLQIIKLQYEAGQVTSLAVQQADAQRLSAARLVPQFEQNIAIQENALRILAGQLPEKILRSGTLDQITVPDNISQGVPSSILTHRSDVLSSELALNIANANVGIAKAEMYPALRITASGGVNSFKASNWFNLPASLFGIVGGSVVQPLLDRKKLKTEYEVAKINREKVVLQFRQSVLNAVGEVSDALVRIEKLKAEHIIAANRVKTLEAATGNANQLFKNGMANYLEVVTAQSNVLQSELELAAVKESELSAVADLYRSVGGGWR